VVRPERFELPTLWFVARCSIQLSYGRAACVETACLPAGRPRDAAACRRCRQCDVVYSRSNLSSKFAPTWRARKENVARVTRRNPTGTYYTYGVVPCDPTDAVCGASNFVIAIGFENDGVDGTFSTTQTPDLTAGAGADGTPVSEPPTLLLLFVGLLGIPLCAQRFRARTRLVASTQA
jgi:hypothetical protein